MEHNNRNIQGTRSILPRLEPGTLPLTAIVEVSPASTTERSSKRRCISTACMPCRKRKSKCDGVKPNCFACVHTYATPCIYDIDSDHRRKGALKREIADLKEERKARNVILDALKAASNVDVDDIINLIRANPDESYESIALNVQKLDLETKHKAGNPGGPMLYGLEGELANLSSLPKLDKTGDDLRHYGHTSNLVYNETNEEDILNGEDQMESWTKVTNDTGLISHLLDLYFTWSHPFYLIFSEEVFYHGFRNRKLKYCSPLLVNALLALGCVYSDRPEAKSNPDDPKTRGGHFFAEAKRLLEGDDRSSLTTVQALGIMSIRQAKHDCDSPGWQYASQMVGMAVQLGLHIQSAAEPNMTPSEIEARRVTFWGIFTLQTCWSVCVGRVPALPFAAIRLDKPLVNRDLEMRPWKPHGLWGGNATNQSLIQPSHKYSFFTQNSLLSEILNDILHMFYAPRDRITSRKLQYYHDKLQIWYKNLPDNLQMNENGPTLPQVYALHMFYNSCIIHLFRPWLKVSFVQTSKTPRQICTEKANRISQLMHQYDETYGPNPTVFIQSHCVMSAAIIHLVDITSTPTTTNSSARHHSEKLLADSIRYLYSIKDTYPLVDRYREAIVGLTYKWFTISIPKQVQEAISDSRIESAATLSETHTLSISAPSGFSTPETKRTRPNGTLERKHSAPDLVEMAPQPPSDRSSSYPQTLHNMQNFHGTGNASSIDMSINGYEGQLLWSPFADSSDGMPLLMPPTIGAGGHAMSVTGMLGGDFPQFYQDGFTLDYPGGIGFAGEGMNYEGNWEGGVRENLEDRGAFWTKERGRS